MIGATWIRNLFDILAMGGVRMDQLYRILNSTIEQQDAQIKAFDDAKALIASGETEAGIKMLERIVYEDGIIIRGEKWPFILPDACIEAKQYDRAWKCLNHLDMEKIGDVSKIRQRQAKIHQAEGRHLDALAAKLAELITKHSRPETDSAAKALKPFVKRAEVSDRDADVLSLYRKHCNSDRFNEADLRKELKAIAQR